MMDWEPIITDCPTVGIWVGFITRLYGEIDRADAGAFRLGAGDIDRALAGR